MMPSSETPLSSDPTGDWQHLAGSSQLRHVRLVHSADPHAPLRCAHILLPMSSRGAAPAQAATRAGRNCPERRRQHWTRPRRQMRLCLVQWEDEGKAKRLTWREEEFSTSPRALITQSARAMASWGSAGACTSVSCVCTVGDGVLLPDFMLFTHKVKHYLHLLFCRSHG